MPTEPGQLDENAERYLVNALAAGTAVLFTGAGFSRGAQNRQGEPLPLGSELARDLWDVAFPGEPFDAESELRDVYAVASRSAGNATKRLLEQKLLVQTDSIADYYKDFLSIPWFKIYTLNLDNLIPAAVSRFALPTEIETVSALRPRTVSGLMAVHLNGIVTDFPDVTFSAPQFGARTASPDPFYDILTRELYGHPVVFVGTALDEPPLWHHMALRGSRPDIGELRPKSFLVVPSLSVARRAMLERYNVKWIAMDGEAFCDRYLTPNLADGSIAALTPIPTPPNFEDVAVARAEPAPDLPDFLRGREPQWADVATGFAVQRTCENRVVETLATGTGRALVLTGTAGNGKSTLMRRLALQIQTSGFRVLWLRLDAPGTIAELRSEAIVSGQETYVFVDDLQRFGSRGVELLRTVAETPTGPVIVAAMHSTSYEELHVAEALYGLEFENLVVPNLDDQEIDDLLGSLERANRLGHLAGLSLEERRREFTGRAHRQLLVAMIEATSGRRFEDKVSTECRELPGDLMLAYVTTVVATVNHYPLPREVLLAALSDYSSEGLAIIERLCRQHLLLRLPGERLVARHPVIAREAVSYYRSAGQLIDGYERLAFALASRISPNERRSAERRLLNRLTNHMSVHAATDSRPRVREMYEQLEPLLRSDAHYWLQRGAYEVERGDVDLADLFLATSRSLSSNDYMVETEWAYLMLRRACENPQDHMARSWVDEAQGILFDIIADRGQSSPNTYVVLADKTVEWCERASLLPSEERDLLHSVRGVMKDGRKWHQGNRQFESSLHDLEHAYLSLAVTRQEEG